MCSINISKNTFRRNIYKRYQTSFSKYLSLSFFLSILLSLSFPLPLSFFPSSSLFLSLSILSLSLSLNANLWTISSLFLYILQKIPANFLVLRQYYMYIDTFYVKYWSVLLLARYQTIDLIFGIIFLGNVNIQNCISKSHVYAIT